MISCTEFIPSYSELFTFLEDRYGREEVEKFWDYLFKPTGEGIPLINFVKKEGIRGCYTYWSGTLNEEAADFTLYLNEKAGWFALIMHRCPSKGMLLELKEKIGIVPYHDYCMHCDHYRASCEKVGLKYLYNFIGIDKAACSIFIYDPKIFQGKMVVDENTEIMDRRASDNEYFHKDFHSSVNMGIDYLGEQYGKDVLVDYLNLYTEHVYDAVLQNVRRKGLKAIDEFIKDTYKKEKAEDLIETKLSDNLLIIKIESCPAVKHLRETGREVSKWYVYTTTAIMEKLAAECGAKFVLQKYDKDTGAAEYSFEK